MIFSVASAEEIRYDSANRRDPFVPLIGPDGMGGEGGLVNETISVEGIFLDPKSGSYAVIDGEIYQEGESIEGAKIVQILSDRVIFLQESKEMVIWLREETLAEGKEEEGLPHS